MARNETHIQEARQEARRIVDEGYKIVGDMKRENEQSARREAESLLHQARLDIDREVQKSLGELKTTVADLSVRIARQVIEERLNETQHTALADRLIDNLSRPDKPAPP